jgi:hypothetical protein
MLNLSGIRVASQRLIFTSAAILGLLSGTPATALSLNSAELAAAKQLGCVLADDALGYLNEQQFNDLFDAAVENFSDDQVDVVYAKALGYIDGLLFGVPSGADTEASGRLQAFSNSDACSRFLPVRYESVSL